MRRKLQIVSLLQAGTCLNMPACTAELQLREEEEEDGEIFVYIATALSQQHGLKSNLLSHFCSLT